MADQEGGHHVGVGVQEGTKVGGALSGRDEEGNHHDVVGGEVEGGVAGVGPDQSAVRVEEEVSCEEVGSGRVSDQAGLSG